MNWLEPPAFGLLGALAALAWLVFMQRGAKRLDVGTLFIWRHVAAKQDARRKRARLEPVLWLCAIALIAAALASARPALAQGGAAPVVAVFIERVAGGDLPEVEATRVLDLAQEAAPGATLEFYATGRTGLAAVDERLKLLAPGPIADELAQFRAHSRGANARLLFLCAAEAGVAEWGLVLPRVGTRQDGVLFAISLRSKRIYLRSSGFGAPEFKGAQLIGARTSQGETAREYEATAPEVEFRATNGQVIRLHQKAALVLSMGGQWRGDAHRALVQALPDVTAHPAGGGDVGLDRDAPKRIEILRGKGADLAGAEASFDAQHPLFAQLPLSAFDWIADGRLLAAEEGERVLLTATRGGTALGALIVLSADGKALRFAGDPFSRAPVAAAALLLDNALGVLTGERPSERQGLQIVSGAALPSERAAFAAPFEPLGSLDVSTAAGVTVSELAPWLALMAALLALGAAWLTR